MKQFSELQKTSSLIIAITLGLLAVVYTPSEKAVSDAVFSDFRRLGQLEGVLEMIIDSTERRVINRLEVDLLALLKRRFGDQIDVSNVTFDESIKTFILGKRVEKELSISNLVELLETRKINYPTLIVSMPSWEYPITDKRKILSLEMDPPGLDRVTINARTVNEDGLVEIVPIIMRIERAVNSVSRLAIQAVGNEVLSVEIYPLNDDPIKNELPKEAFKYLDYFRKYSTEWDDIKSLTYDDAFSALSDLRAKAKHSHFFGFDLPPAQLLRGSLAIYFFLVFSMMIRIRFAIASGATQRAAARSGWLFAIPGLWPKYLFLLINLSLFWSFYKLFRFIPPPVSWVFFLECGALLILSLFVLMVFFRELLRLTSDSNRRPAAMKSSDMQKEST